MSANDKQIAGDHYTNKKIQHWDFAASQNFDYFQGNITKYISRWKDKKGLEDLEKAQHYLEKYIEIIKCHPHNYENILADPQDGEGEDIVVYATGVTLQSEVNISGEEPTSGYVDQDR